MSVLPSSHNIQRDHIQSDQRQETNEGAEDEP